MQRLRFIQFLLISDCMNRAIPQQLGPTNRATDLSCGGFRRIDWVDKAPRCGVRKFDIRFDTV
jgi:hypothetical protein